MTHRSSAPEKKNMHQQQNQTPASQIDDASLNVDKHHKPTEVGGPKGAEPTRFGDWEKNGRCSDF